MKKYDIILFKGDIKMKIIKSKMICPNCKKEYENMNLASYSSGFENAAKDFIQNNKIITQCENCNTKLIPESLIDNFDSNGNYAPKQKEFDKDYDLFKLYLEVLNNIQSFFSCVDNGKIVLSSKIDKNDDKYSTALVLTGNIDDKNFNLLSATIYDYTIEMGDRKNYFMLLNLCSITNLVVSNIYDYIFMDDVIRFKDEDKINILKELIDIDIEHL